MTLQPLILIGLALSVGIVGCSAIQEKRPVMDKQIFQEFTEFANTFDVSVLEDDQERFIVSSAIRHVKGLFVLIETGSTYDNELETKLMLAKLYAQQVKGVYMRHRHALSEDKQAIYDEWAIRMADRILKLEVNTLTTNLSELLAVANSIKQLAEVIRDVRGRN